MGYSNKYPRSCLTGRISRRRSGQSSSDTGQKSTSTRQTWMVAGWLLFTIAFHTAGIANPAIFNARDHTPEPSITSVHIQPRPLPVAGPERPPLSRKARYATNRRFRFSLWLRSLFSRLPARGYTVLYGLFLGSGLFLLGYFLISLMRQFRRKPPSPLVVSRPSTPQRPPQPDAYLKAALDWIDRGQYREAIHGLYLALAQSAAAHWPSWRATDTPREWITRLVREDPFQPYAREFMEFLNLYERVWFGFHPTNETALREQYRWTQKMSRLMLQRKPTQ